MFLLLTAIPVTSSAMKPSEPDTLQTSAAVATKKSNFFRRTVDFINRQLEQDTSYVAPSKYVFSLKPEYKFGYEHYRFATKDKTQSITLNPASHNKIGLHLGWKWIFISYNFTLGESQPEFDFELNLYKSRIGIELFYRKRNDGFSIKSIKGFYDNEQPLDNYNREFNGLTSSQIGGNIFYVFNYKKFSFPAAYSRSASQRRSAGSFILGVSYKEQMLTFDHTKFDPRITEQMSTELQFKKIDYKDFSINFGYSYNWVFAKNFLANISVSPSIGYKNTSFRFITNHKEFMSNINIDLISRMALVYNNDRFYAGASIVSHTYTYNETSLSILNSFGYIKVYAGINFWRKKSAR